MTTKEKTRASVITTSQTVEVVQEPDVSQAQMVSMLRQMLRIRVIEEEIAERYAEREMRCPVHLCIGQEAVPVGVCGNLSQDDYVFGTHRSHGHYLAKGGNVNAMVAELYGKLDGCAAGKGGSMHLVDLDVGFLGATSIVGSTLPMAVGAAMASSMRGEDRVTVVFLGDGATEEGVFHESLNFSVLKNLPVVFVCENNFYSVYSPLSVRQPSRREIYELARAHGLDSREADGNDVVAIHQLSRELIAEARAGKGPTFLEFKTYRWRAHCGGRFDNDLGYRSQEEFRIWELRCPIELLKTQLVENGTLAADDLQVMTDELRQEAEDAIQFSKRSPFPGEDDLMQHIYAE